MVTHPRSVHAQSLGQHLRELRSRDQLRRNCITAMLMLLAMVAVLGLIIWLASLGEPTPANDVDFWMMP
jgi:hypothetical protein